MTTEIKKNLLVKMKKTLLLCGLGSTFLAAEKDVIAHENKNYAIEKEIDNTNCAGFSKEMQEIMQSLEQEKTLPYAGFSIDLYNISKYGTPSGVVHVEENNIDMVQAPDENQVYEEFLKIYATYFHFNPEKVVELAHILTDDYQIPFEEINQMSSYDFDNPEASALVFVYQLNRNKFKQAGYNKEDFIINDSIDHFSEDYILANGLTYNQFLEKVCNLLQLNKNYALAVSFHESGWLTCENAKLYNNFGGMLYSNREPMRFLSPEAGVIAFCCNLNRYKDFDLHSLDELSGMYYYGDKTQVKEHWEEEVSWFYNEISNNTEKYFINDTPDDYKVKFR